MIKLIIIALFALSVEAKEWNVLVTGWTPHETRDYVLVLKTPYKRKKLILDCQSFFHELVLYNDHNEVLERLFTMYLDAKECLDLGHFIISHTDRGKKICFTYDDIYENLSIDVENYELCY